MPTTQPSIADCLRQLEASVAGGTLKPATAANVRRWLIERGYEDFIPPIAEHVTEQNWAALEAAFWRVLPFGTAGRRGPMYPIGTATINDRTIGESAQGLAEYVLEHVAHGGEPRAAVAYDTRHRSRHFAELCAEVLAAAGFTVYFLDGFRPTPELSFTIRQLGCHAGIMVSASHNPPQDNAVKVFGPSGGQLRPPDDERLARAVDAVTTVRRHDFGEAAGAGRIVFCQEEMDRLYRAAVLRQSFPGPREAQILYSPLHGVGCQSVLPVLAADGFSQVEVFERHAEPNGDFPNVPGQIANPENPAVFDELSAAAAKSRADLALASDPDADRIGCSAPTTPGGAWRVLNGNQIGVLLADYLLRHRRARGDLTAEHYLVTTLVTTGMIRRVADHYGVKTVDDVLTGFKWIGGVVDDLGPERFVFGCEEAHGYMAGDYVRDKDAAVAAMLLAELAAELKAEGLTLHQQLERLHKLVGYHEERTIARTLPGAAGLERMRAIMHSLRTEPPRTLAGLPVQAIRDYETSVKREAGGRTSRLTVPRSDLLFFDTELPGNYAAVRPSGTEPKLKYYLFAYRPPGEEGDAERQRSDVERQLTAMEADLMRAGG
ncbi:MAG TPA: phospho-sugar mutase [Pirellulales bacterium]|nr:phospho-sugar mutase [Pirellulales bacterium]